MKVNKFILVFCLFSSFLLGTQVNAQQTDIPGPAGSGNFGRQVVVLSNGNFVVTDPLYDSGSLTDVGAVYLYNGVTLELISTLVGRTAGDQIGSSGLTVLSNGNFVVQSSSWDSAGLTNIGAITLCSGTTGCNGMVTAENSLYGTSVGDGPYFTVTALNNGNFVVTNSLWDNPSGGVQNAGAITFCNGMIGCSGAVSPANSLIGSSNGDTTSVGIRVLSNGNYVVTTPRWKRGSITAAGAVTFCSGTTGCTGNIGTQISLYGSAVGDQVGAFIALPNGNYLIWSRDWDNSGAENAGAVTFCSGTTGCRGEVSANNSLVGLSANDSSQERVKVLSNGNYLVLKHNWDNPAGNIVNVGAVSFCSGTDGCTGAISGENSLIGISVMDSVGVEYSNIGGAIEAFTGVIELSNGNYVVGAPLFDNASITNAGAVRFCSGTTGCSGFIGGANSLVGSKVNDRIGSNLTALTNGNYVVTNPDWHNDGAIDVGAATFCSGTSGCSGTVSAANSLIGSTSGDFAQPSPSFYTPVVPLSNGNYVVNAAGWSRSSQIPKVGAIVLCSGTTGCSGAIDPANSLTGSKVNDLIGYDGIDALSNGNYVIKSSRWSSAQVNNVGAVTFCNGSTGCRGLVVSVANSLTGSSGDDLFALSTTVLPNGNYIVRASAWDNFSTGADSAGAVTFCSGTNGCTGVISPENSLVGTTANDRIGSTSLLTLSPTESGIVILRNGNYLVTSFRWHNGGAMDAGAVTFCKGTSGCTGAVGAANSLIGSTTDDNIGRIGIIRILPNGNYLVNSIAWDNPTGPIINAGAVTLGDGNNGTTGVINGSNSIIETFHIDSLPVDYDEPRNRVFVGQPRRNIVSIRAFNAARTKFDFDGDGKADVSVFRPENGTWYIQQSSAGFSGTAFGVGTDKLVPTDYDGDGKTDVAVFRPSNGAWYLQRSQLGFTGFAFGANGDVPMPADYDGDGKADLAVFRPSNGVWYIQQSTNGFIGVSFGTNGDSPVAADYDGDGKADIAVFRPANGVWYLNRSQLGFTGVAFGATGDKPVPVDYDGDGKTDIAVFRPGNSVWYLQQSTAGFAGIGFGANGDLPVAADYDGDGKADVSVFRPSNSVWYLQQSSNGFTGISFGASGDKPAPNSFIP